MHTSRINGILKSIYSKIELYQRQIAKGTIAIKFSA